MREGPQESQRGDALFEAMLNDAQVGLKAHRLQLWIPKPGRKWFSKLLIILLYIGFTPPTPVGCNISSSACLWCEYFVQSHVWCQCRRTEDLFNGHSITNKTEMICGLKRGLVVSFLPRVSGEQSYLGVQNWRETAEMPIFSCGLTLL